MAAIVARRCLFSSCLTIRSSSRFLCTSNKVTHTGQLWTPDDHRNARFIDRKKQVNEQFAINLVAEEPPVRISGSHTWCDGGDEALGHPKVYINLDKPEIGVCGYCGKRFVSTQH